MKPALPESRTTHSFHKKTGFVAWYLRCLHHTAQHRAAENFADACLRAWHKEIFEHRWHAFFTAWFEVLPAQKNYPKIMKRADKHPLPECDATFADKIAQIEELLEEIKGHVPTLTEELRAWMNHRFPAGT